MKYISERIMNLKEFEGLVESARAFSGFLTDAIKRKELERAQELNDLLDLKLHEIGMYQFNIEQREVIGNNHPLADSEFP